jgi:hypothetical protein
MNPIKRFLTQVDFLTESPKLRIQNQRSYKTIVGGLMSVSISILSITFIIYFGKEIWEKKEPSVIISAKDFTEIGPFEVGPEVFNLAIGLEYANYTWYNERSIFHFEANEQRIYIENGIQTKMEFIPLEMSTCSNYYNSSSEISNNTSLDINIMHCIKPHTSKIEGFWGAPYTSMVNVYLKKCTNNTEYNKCKPKEEIENAIQGGILGIYLTTNELVMNNNKEPVRKNFVSFLNSLNNQLTYSCFIFLNPLEFIDDKGFLLEDLNIVNTFEFNQPTYLYYGPR